MQYLFLIQMALPLHLQQQLDSSADSRDGCGSTLEDNQENERRKEKWRTASSTCQNSDCFNFILIKSIRFSSFENDTPQYGGRKQGSNDKCEAANTA